MPQAKDAPESRLEKGRAITRWLRSGMRDPQTGEERSAAQVARMVKASTTIVGVWLNDCRDGSDPRVKLPGEDKIDLLAEKLGLDANEGRRIIGRPPAEYDIDPQLRHLHTGDSIRINPNDPDPDSTVRATEVFISTWRQMRSRA